MIAFVKGLFGGMTFADVKHPVGRALGFLAALELGSFLFHFYPWTGNAIFLAIVAGVFIASLRHLEVGLAALLLDLMIDSHGHMVDFSYGAISIRIGMFAAVMVAWLIGLIRDPKQREKFYAVPWRYPVFITVVAYGIVRALSLHRGLGAIINDANAYGFLLLAFPVFAVREKIDMRRFLAVFGAGLAWLGMKTMTILYVYSHFNPQIMRALYMWVRDTRVAEVTHIVSFVYRVFLPSQLWLLPAVLGAKIAFRRHSFPAHRKLNFIILALLWAVMFVSLSRTFIIALAAGLFVFGLVVHLRRELRPRETGRLILHSLGAILTGFLIVTAVVNFPIPPNRGFASLSDILKDRYLNYGDAAIGARWALLKPLQAGIMEHPVLGSGFGKEITYYSPDPFWRDINPDGRVTTTAFEWGYLDFLLKFGALGTLALLVALSSLLLQLYRQARTTGGTLDLTLLASYVALLVTHVFTPYLNHPIGLGMLLVIDVIHSRYANRNVFEKIIDAVKA